MTALRYKKTAISAPGCEAVFLIRCDYFLPGCVESNNSSSVNIFYYSRPGKVIEYTINFLTAK